MRNGLKNMIKKNKGFDPIVIGEYKTRIKKSGRSFVSAAPEEDGDEYRRIFFVGTFNGREAIFDAAIYTLRLQHESELFELAEQKAAAHFPHYHDVMNEPADTPRGAEQEKEIGLFIADAIAEMEEEEFVKVKEHADLDLEHDFGIGLDVGLNENTITPAMLEKLIADFNADRLQLDDTLVSFQTEEDDDS
jgi:hypothetical protein